MPEAATAPEAAARQVRMKKEGGSDKALRSRRYESKRRVDKPWRKWYKSKHWLTRRDIQLKSQPLCELHLARGHYVPATVANHKVPHRGDWRLFSQGVLQSVCKECHDGPIQASEHRGFYNTIGLDGFPIDPNHPANSKT